MKKTVKILAIDGGGIRGIIPAIVLLTIERRLGRSISEVFDLIAGTSAGGVLALSLVRPDESGKPMYSLADIVKLYEDNSEAMFSRSLWHAARAVGNLTEVKYDGKGLEKYIRSVVGDARLSEALTPTMVTAYEIERQRPFIFKSYRARKNEQFDFDMFDVARATVAAPSYFEPHRIDTEDVLGYYALVDGLIYASNPAMCAYVEAHRLFPDADEIILLSLGTGLPPHRQIYDEVKSWGAVKWAQPLLMMVLYGSAVTIDYQLRYLMPEKDGSRRYFRFQTKLHATDSEFDNPDPSHIRKLKLLAEEMLEEQSTELDELCKRLGE